MVRLSQLASAFVRPNDSAFDGGAQPGCTRERRRRDGGSTHGVRALQTTTLPGRLEPVSPDPRSPQRCVIA